jgi:four helix bundle protein
VGNGSGEDGGGGGSPSPSRGGAYRRLVVWQKAMALHASVYRLTQEWPSEERFGRITSQVRRAAVSVPANIAEGRGKVSSREYRQHLAIARGSLWEVETLLLAACDIRYADERSIAPHLSLSDEIGRMLSTMIDRLDDRTR